MGSDFVHPSSYVHGPLMQKGFLAMQTAKQISVSLVNKPGRLADMLNALAKEKVAFRRSRSWIPASGARSDSCPRSSIRPSECFKASTFVTKQPMFCWSTCPISRAQFRKICEKLAAEHLNIDYAYSSFANGKGVTAVVRVNDLAKAQRVLGENTAAARAPRRPGRRPAFAR